MSNSKSRHMMNRSYIKEVIRELKVIGHEDDRAKEILINTVVKRGEEAKGTEKYKPWFTAKQSVELK